MPKGYLNSDLDRVLVMAEKSDPTYLAVSAPEVRKDKCMEGFLKIKNNFKELCICHLTMF